MIELMTSSQFTNYKKAMKEHCPDFDHGCDGTPLCADKKEYRPVSTIRTAIAHSREFLNIG